MGTGVLTVIPQFLMGVGLVFVFSVTFDLLPNAAAWLPPLARRLLPNLPTSGRDLDVGLGKLGLRVH